MEKRPFSVGLLHSPQDFQDCERLQQVIWRPDPGSIPKAKAAMLIAMQRYGGMAMGAWDESGQMVGFLFSFPGTVPSDNPAMAGAQWQQCSRVMGVLPEWQGQGVGYRLKLAQREWTLRQGMELVGWTFDPLEAGNGTLNLGKLGAICHCYLRDLYGDMGEALNIGLPTDRYEVAWWLTSARVTERVERGWRAPQWSELHAAGVTVLNPAHLHAAGGLEPGGIGEPRGARLLIEIPARIQQVKAHSMELALAWRLSVREASEVAFAAGYSAVDAVRAEVDGVPRVYYLLEQDSSFVLCQPSTRDG